MERAWRSFKHFFPRLRRKLQRYLELGWTIETRKAYVSKISYDVKFDDSKLIADVGKQERHACRFLSFVYRLLVASSRIITCLSQSTKDSMSEPDVKRFKMSDDRLDLPFMKGLWLDGEQGSFQVKTNLTFPVPSYDEVLIKVLLAGICSTDLQLIRKYKGGFFGILGHEFVGRVVDSPDEKLLGKIVTGSINIAKCGKPPCKLCREFLEGNHCLSREVLGIYKKTRGFCRIYHSSEFKPSFSSRKCYDFTSRLY